MRPLLFTIIVTLFTSTSFGQYPNSNRTFAGDEKYVKELDSISLLIKKSPTNSTLYFERYKIGRFKIADSRKYNLHQFDLDKCISLDSTNAKYYFERASYYQDEKKDYKAALKDLDSAIKFESDNPKYFKSRGSLKYFDLEDKIGGCSDWTIGSKLKDKEPFAYMEGSQETCERFLERCK